MKYTFVSISSQVDKFLQDKESGTVEFKSALGGFRSKKQKVFDQ